MHKSRRKKKLTYFVKRPSKLNTEAPISNNVSTWALGAGNAVCNSWAKISPRPIKRKQNDSSFSFPSNLFSISIDPWIKKSEEIKMW